MGISVNLIIKQVQMAANKAIRMAKKAIGLELVRVVGDEVKDCIAIRMAKVVEWREIGILEEQVTILEHLQRPMVITQIMNVLYMLEVILWMTMFMGHMIVVVMDINHMVISIDVIAETQSMVFIIFWMDCQHQDLDWQIVI